MTSRAGMLALAMGTSAVLLPPPDATDRLIKAAEVVDIKVVDHFIITETQYFSFNEAGLIKQLRNSSAYKVLSEDEVELLKLQMQAEGIAKGKDISKAERKKEIAKAMLAEDFAVEQVKRLTRLRRGVLTVVYRSEFG